MNNFQTPAGQPPKPHLKLITSMFQGLFPPIQVEKVSLLTLVISQNTPVDLSHERLQSALPSFRRVLLVSYHAESNLISVRHYTITVRPHGVSRRVRKILTSTAMGGKPDTSRGSRKVDLSNADDIADYLLRKKRDGSSVPSESGTAYTDTTGTGSGWDSASETDASEAESDSNAVDLPEDYVGRGNKKGERRAVRLIEVGPRLELRLIKIAEGLVGSKRGEGETVFHEFGEYIPRNIFYGEVLS
jgi:ribosome biogenesis protein SSF1/2